MGLEAICLCRIDGHSAEAKVLLEARDLIFRAPFRRTVRVLDLGNVAVVGDALCFSFGKSRAEITLGAVTAAKWAAKIATPPRGLAEKLGIGHASPAFVIGTVDAPELREVLEGHTSVAAAAKLSIVVVRKPDDLDAAIIAHERLPERSPIWIVHGKGPMADFGEAAVRRHMRDRGYIDSKSSAVSPTLSGTRYSVVRRCASSMSASENSSISVVR